ncbi:unnamed protein product [Prunus armeniaca]
MRSLLLTRLPGLLLLSPPLKVLLFIRAPRPDIAYDIDALLQVTSYSWEKQSIEDWLTEFVNYCESKDQLADILTKAVCSFFGGWGSGGSGLER